jgi:hypothetical protein
MLAPLVAVLLSSAPRAAAQNATAAQASAPTKRARSGRNAQSEDADINSHLKPLSCPKGFRPAKAPGPHLTPMRSASAGSVLGRRTSRQQSMATKATAFGRRCVPIAPAKPAAAAAPAAAAPPTAPAAKDPPREQTL